jgi:CelD/BcsL family acetyltransferase involved in cellulose biosynthesis
MDACNSYRIERLTSLAQIEALKKEWSDLIEEIPDVSIFQTWEWTKTWWLYFGEGHQLWLLTARDQHDKLVGIAPLMSEAYKKGLIKLCTLVFIGTGSVCPVHLKILSPPMHQNSLYEAFLNFLWSQKNQWDILRITSVPEGSTINDLLIHAGGRIRSGAKILSMTVPLPGTWEDYYKTLSLKSRKNIRTAQSKLNADYPGMVEYACVTDPQELHGVMETLFEIIQNRCHSQSISTAFDDPSFIDFHHAISKIALDHGWLRLHTINIEGNVIGVSYCFRYRNCIFGYNAGYNINWRKYSPGTLLMAHVIRSSIQEAADVLDMGQVSAEYKFSWTDHVSIENEILFSRNWRGNLWIELSNRYRDLKERSHLAPTLAITGSLQSIRHNV